MVLTAMEWDHERILVSGRYAIMRADLVLPSGRTARRFRLLKDGEHACFCRTVRQCKSVAEWDGRP